MTHTDYLEAHHELTNKALSELAIRHGKQDYEGATELLTQLRAKLSDMWTKYMGDASRTVAP